MRKNINMGDIDQIEEYYVVIYLPFVFFMDHIHLSLTSQLC